MTVDPDSVMSARWCERTLASRSGKQLLLAFWVSLAMQCLGAVSTSLIARAFGVLGQIGVALVYAGYPIAVFVCLADPRRRALWAVALVASFALGYSLAVFADAKSGGAATSTLVSIAGAALFLTPFIAASFALTRAEHRGMGQPGAGVALTALMFLSLPYFGAWLHARFRRLFAALQPEGSGSG